MFYIYLLQSVKNNSLYSGYSSDLRKRLKEHNQGSNFSIKAYKPWKVIYYEACILKSDAKRREKYLKTTQGVRMLKLRLKDYFEESRKI